MIWGWASRQTVLGVYGVCQEALSMRRGVFYRGWFGKYLVSCDLCRERRNFLVLGLRMHWGCECWSLRKNILCANESAPLTTERYWVICLWWGIVIVDRRLSLRKKAYRLLASSHSHRALESAPLIYSWKFARSNNGLTRQNTELTTKDVFQSPYAHSRPYYWTNFVTDSVIFQNHFLLLGKMEVRSQMTWYCTLATSDLWWEVAK